MIEEFEKKIKNICERNDWVINDSFWFYVGIESKYKDKAVDVLVVKTNKQYVSFKETFEDAFKDIIDKIEMDSIKVKEE